MQKQHQTSTPARQQRRILWLLASVGGLLLGGLLLGSLQPPLAPAAFAQAGTASAPQAGSAVQATDIASTTERLYLPLIVMPFSVQTIDITATPDTLLANGRRTAAIDVTLLDTRGEGLPNATVTLSTTHGTFFGGTATVSLQSNEQGKASAMLQAPALTESGIAATITAQVRNPNNTIVNSSININLLPFSVSTVQLESETAIVPANGMSTVPIVVSVLDEENGRVPNYALTLTTSWGTFPNNDTSIEIVTNEAGVASTDLRSAYDVETRTVTVSAEVDTGQGILIEQIELRFVAPERVLPSVTLPSIPANVASSSALQVTVQGPGGIALPFYPVSFINVFDLGYLPNLDMQWQTQTDENGIARALLRASPDLGTATYTARAGNVGENLAVTFTLDPAGCNDIENDPRYQEGDARHTNDTINGAKGQNPAVCLASLEDDPEGEDDYYVLPDEDIALPYISMGQTVEVELTNIPAGADYDLVLYNEARSGYDGSDYITFSNELGSVNERIIYTKTQGPAQERYYIRINMYQKSTTNTNSYQLRVVIDPPPLLPLAETTAGTAGEEQEDEPAPDDLPAPDAAMLQAVDPPLPAKPRP